MSSITIWEYEIQRIMRRGVKASDISIDTAGHTMAFFFYYPIVSFWMYTTHTLTHTHVQSIALQYARCIKNFKEKQKYRWTLLVWYISERESAIYEMYIIKQLRHWNEKEMFCDCVLASVNIPN